MTKLPRKAVQAATLSDIASAAGVSVGTVSKALNARVGVSPRNRERILRTVEQLGYQKPEAKARAEGVLEAATIVTFDRYAANDHFYGEILRGIAEEAERNGVPISVELLFIGEGETTIDPSTLFQRAPPKSVILMGIDQPGVVDALARLGCPAVLVNGMDPTMRIGSVSPDYHFGGWAAARYLLDRGHRKIAHVTHAYRETLSRRLEGFRKALVEAGIDFDADRHVIDLESPGLLSVVANQVVTRRIKEGRFDATALCCVSDMVAIGAMQALLAAGYRVPEDVSVIGFDDLPIGAHAAVPLSTVHIERAEMGRQAVRMLMEAAASPLPCIRRVCLGVRLVERQSVMAIA